MIDFRTHLASHALFESLSKRSPGRIPAARALAHVSGEASLPNPILDEHVMRWLDLFDRHGVSHAVSVSGHDDETPIAAEAAERSKGRLLAFAPLDAGAGDATARAEELVGSGGFRGVVLRPAVDGYKLSDDRCESVLEVLEDHGAVAVVDYGLPRRPLERAFGIHAPFHAELANPLDLLTPAERHAELTFVVSHLGAGYFRELLMLASHCSNVYTETSWSTAGLRGQAVRMNLTDQIQRCLDVMGSGRVLFATGSDRPSVGWHHEALLRLREALGASGASEEDIHLVLDGNARRVLGLPVPEAPAIPQTH